MQEEIKISNPDIVIFFSGPNYDNWIIPQFDDNINFEQINENIPKRELARLSDKVLPMHTFRTYHPILYRGKKMEFHSVNNRFIMSKATYGWVI